MSETDPDDAEEAERLLNMIYYMLTRNIFGNGKLVLENSEIYLETICHKTHCHQTIPGNQNLVISRGCPLLVQQTGCWPQENSSG